MLKGTIAIRCKKEGAKLYPRPGGYLIQCHPLKIPILKEILVDYRVSRVSTCFLFVEDKLINGSCR